MAAINPPDPMRETNLEEDPSIEGLELEDSVEQVEFSAPGQPEHEPEETVEATPDEGPDQPEPEATHPPAMDDEVQAKLTRLQELERDQEISRILHQREEAARQQEMEQARAAAERKQVDDYFSKQRQDIVTMFNANQLSPEQFVVAMDSLSAARVEVSNRQMQQHVTEYVQSAIEGRLGQISSGYKERTAFANYAPELVEANPQVSDVIENWRMKYGIPQEEISLIIETSRKAYKGPVQRSNTQEAQQAARRAGAVEPPTRATRPSKQSEAEEDKEMRALAKQMFS